MRRQLFHVASAVLLALLFCAFGPARAAAAPWLVVSDVHYNPAGSADRLSGFGEDTDPALLAASLAAMRRIDPNPPVVLVTGDLLAHNFRPGYALSTMADLAHRFNEVFPHSQFILVLGNNDSNCGDYRSQPGSEFMRGVAAAWAPLVNRNGAAPSFRRDFSQRGSYVAKLPAPGLRAVVIDDIPWSWRYQPCGNTKPNAADDQLRWLRQTLSATPAGEKNWLVMHIPPGVDPFSTRYVHGLAIVPFLEARADAAFLRSVNDPANRVAFVLAGHSHKFSFRLSDAKSTDDDVPILLAPSISPVYRNNPSFLTLDTDAQGGIRNVTEIALIDGQPITANDFHADYGLPAVNGKTLADLHQRIMDDPNVREKFVHAYDGQAQPSEIRPDNFVAYWCAQTELEGPEYRTCAGTSVGGKSYPRIIAAAAIFVVALSAIWYVAARFYRRTSIPS
ncbi:MAG: metallophosphoesterase [Vulcanimicrobiaceae bacterium]